MKITASQLRRIIAQETRNIMKEGVGSSDPQLAEYVEERFGGLLHDMQGGWDDPRIKDAIMSRLDVQLDAVLADLASRG